MNLRWTRFPNGHLLWGQVHDHRNRSANQLDLPREVHDHQVEDSLLALGLLIQQVEVAVLPDENHSC